MLVCVEDEDLIDVEQLTLDEARLVLARAEAELVFAYNAGHAESLRREIAEVSEQVEWLEEQVRRVGVEDAAVEHDMDLWAERGWGVVA